MNNHLSFALVSFRIVSVQTKRSCPVRNSSARHSRLQVDFELVNSDIGYKCLLPQLRDAGQLLTCLCTATGRIAPHTLLVTASSRARKCPAFQLSAVQAKPQAIAFQAASVETDL